MKFVRISIIFSYKLCKFCTNANVFLCCHVIILITWIPYLLVPSAVNNRFINWTRPRQRSWTRYRLNVCAAARNNRRLCNKIQQANNVFLM